MPLNKETKPNQMWICKYLNHQHDPHQHNHSIQLHYETHQRIDYNQGYLSNSAKSV